MPTHRKPMTERLAELDRQLLQTLNQRFAMIADAPDLARTDHLAALRAENPGPLPDATLTTVYRELLAGAAALVRPVRVAYLGPEGTFTHQAALNHFGHTVDAVSHHTIGDIFDDVQHRRADFGVVPIENSTEGAVTDTCDLFYDHKVLICAEILLEIHHHLLASCPLSDIRTVYSHPQVFGQCRRWLQENLGSCQLVEVSSTSAAAERAAREPHAAALAGAIAGNRYSLEVLRENVEDLSENITRFLVLSRTPAAPSNDDKTSIMLAIKDRVGALYDALLPFRDNGLNLTLIHSRPSRRKNWEYHFFVDYLGRADSDASRRTLDALAPHCKFVKILGTYPRHASS